MTYVLPADGGGSRKMVFRQVLAAIFIAITAHHLRKYVYRPTDRAPHHLAKVMRVLAPGVLDQIRQRSPIFINNMAEAILSR